MRYNLDFLVSLGFLISIYMLYFSSFAFSADILHCSILATHASLSISLRTPPLKEGIRAVSESSHSIKAEQHVMISEYI